MVKGLICDSWELSSKRYEHISLKDKIQKAGVIGIQFTM